ncbi:sporulation histidine kinase inhibitor Sda [Paenibacillus senegalensis]|uniref:sporulation histidine kinase inhibitor Sda n=1 Tax=Paenibacillus senegalensis TaxID=1465766 RepID=UPI000289922B|nr:sporulation histidine kinase inhibitor Sda [Paenibacillus senegalensis]
MTLLNDDILVETYQKAVELNLDREFISLLLAEINRRKLELPLLEQSSSSKGI